MEDRLRLEGSLHSEYHFVRRIASLVENEAIPIGERVRVSLPAGRQGSQFGIEVKVRAD
jgi:hypothetical protein